MMWYLLLLPLLPLCLAARDFEPAPPAASTRAITERTLNVRVNQFDGSDNDTFSMRYYYHDDFTTFGNDIVIFVGGEWAISPGWLSAGLPHEIAQLLGAGLFYTEHRYYGDTQPTDDTSTPSLRWLTVDQALGDLAQFISYVKSDDFEGGHFKSGKVLLIGCSYAGSMATWMKLAYPHLVDVVLSDSGPLHAQEDFPEYLEVITTALREQGGQQCLSTVEEGMAELVALLNTTEGPAQVSQMFNTCTPLQASSSLDLATFFWFGITETFAYLVQTAAPGDIQEACGRLTDQGVAPSALGRLSAYVSSHWWTQPCIESRYEVVLAQFTNTSYSAVEATGRLWTYQTCVEFGWYQTTTSPNQPFLSAVPLEYFHQMCKDFFSSNFDEVFLRAGIERTNLFFGGLTYLPDYVISVAGLHDPWSPMCPNVGHSGPLSPVYLVPEASHCNVIRPTGTGTPAVEQTKSTVLRHIMEYMGQPLPADSAVTANLAISVLLSALLALFVR